MEQLLVAAAAEHYGFIPPGVTTVVAAVSSASGEAVAGLPKARFALLALFESAGEASSVPSLAEIPFVLTDTFAPGVYFLRVQSKSFPLLRDGDVCVLIVTKKVKDDNKSGKGAEQVIARGQAVMTIRRRQLDDFDPA
jgi:hypothetical protein